MLRYNYSKNFKDVNITMLDRNILYNFTLKFFTEILFNKENSITKPTMIILKARFENGTYRSITHSYIILPSSSLDIEKQPAFLNFIAMIDIFYNGNIKNYDLEDIIDMVFEYRERTDVNLPPIETISNYTEIQNFNKEIITESFIDNMLNDDKNIMFKKIIDTHPNNIDINSWYKEEKGNKLFWIDSDLATLDRRGLTYIFRKYVEILYDGTIWNTISTTIRLAYSSSVNRNILSKFIDSGIEKSNTFTRKYYKVITTEELLKLKKSLQQKLSLEIKEDIHSAKDFNDSLQSDNKSIEVSESHDILDRIYVYKDGNLIENRNVVQCKYIDTIIPIKSENLSPKEKIIALDLETRNINGTLEAISVCWYNETEKNSFYISDYIDSQDMLEKAINSLLKFKYNDSSIYIHNLSSFDGIFLLKTIYNLENDNFKINMIYKEGKIIIITISKILSIINSSGKTEEKNFSIKIYDSLLILPSSLSKLGKAFNVSNKMEGWDVKLHDTADLNDPVFRNSLLEYNMNDCIVLHEVIYKFYIECMKEFNISILDSPTLPSIAFKLYRTNYMSKFHKIGITWSMEYSIFINGYRGGHVDVYKPYGKDLYYYDVNSLYPSVMSNKMYPIGVPQFFQYSDFRPLNRNTDLFGICYAKIFAPNNLKAPILLTEHNGKVFAPTGSWEGIYCTEELKNALKYGYKVEVLYGYHWELKDKIFNKYVKTLYDKRLKYPKSDPRNMISKLMLNSLYGRFGLSPYLHTYKSYTNIDPAVFHGLDYIDLDDKILLAKSDFKNVYSQYKECVDNNQKYTLANLSLPIAMFVTAYARMAMAPYKVKYQDNLYYSDTDSIVLDCKLPENVVSNTKLGLFKLEHEIEEAVFLAPKVYALKNKKGEYICKIKGSKNSVDFDIMKSLIVKDSSHSIEQSKWYRSTKNGNILIKDQLYKLRATDNKRNFIFNDEGVWVGTKPFEI